MNIIQKMIKHPGILVLLISLFTVMLAGISCDRQSQDKTTTTEPVQKTPAPYFPVQTEKPGQYLLALLPGKLVMDKDGYLRVGNALVLWPYGYSFSVEGADIWILDDKGVKVARVGDDVKIGGGFIPDNIVPMKIGHPLPAGCEGPFWLANPMSE